MKVSSFILSTVLCQLVSGEYAHVEAVQQSEASDSMNIVAALANEIDGDASYSLELSSSAPGGWNVSLQSRAVEMITKSENFVGHIHLDERGSQCVGFARNIDENKRGRVSLAEANALLESKVDKFTKALNRNFPWAANLDAVRHAAMLAMSFQMGIGNEQRGLKSFKKFLNFMQQGKFAEASVEMLDSGWAKRDSPRRAKRLSQQVSTGVFVIDGYKSPPHAKAKDNFFLQLRVDEGFKPYAYLDTKNLWTFAIGYMIDPKEQGTISLEEGQLLVDMHIEYIVEMFDRLHPYWAAFTPARKVALVWFAYKVTPEGFMTFANAWAALKAQNFTLAAQEMLDSAFAKAAPTKARRITEMVRTGNFPASMQASLSVNDEPAPFFGEENLYGEQMEVNGFDASAEAELRF